jgi:hypothetical protein
VPNDLKIRPVKDIGCREKENQEKKNDNEVQDFPVGKIKPWNQEIIIHIEKHKQGEVNAEISAVVPVVIKIRQPQERAICGKYIRQKQKCQAHGDVQSIESDFFIQISHIQNKHKRLRRKWKIIAVKISFPAELLLTGQS